MQTLRQLECFCAVARCGSFAAASRVLGLAPSSVAKSVGRFEHALGVRLFNRTTRAVQLTSDGEAWLERSAALLEEVDTLTALMRRDATAQGTLKISAPVGYGTRRVVPVLARMLGAHTGLKVDLRLTDERVNLVSEGLDIAIRIGALDDSGLSARLIDRQALILCAAPGYLATHGVPRSPDDLEPLGFLTFRMPSSGRERPVELMAGGQLIRLRPRACLVSNHGEALVEAALQGAGITQVPHYMVAEDLQNGRLVSLLSANQPPPLDVHTLVPSAKMMPSRVRAFIDALVEAFDASRGIPALTMQ